MQLSTFLKILKFVNPKFYNYYNYTIDQKYNLRAELSKVKNKNKELTSILLFIESITNNEKREFLGYEFNEKINTATITYIEHDFGNEYNIIVEAFFGTIHKVVYILELALYKDNMSIYIIDNHALIYENKRNASIGLKALTRFAVNRDYNYIFGEISFTDWGHVDKLKHFYEKQNFNVVLDHGKREGTIRWKNNIQSDVKTQQY